jgi:hypothetical protein
MKEMPFRRFWFVYVLCLWCVGCFFYGFIFFGDGPFHENTSKTPCAAEFCGKSGQPHTREEFMAFIVWQNTLIVSVLIWFPIVFAAGWFARRKKDVSSSIE